MRPQAQPFSPMGIDAPTTAREQGLQPYGAFTLFFRWRKKSVQKKASGTATPGKRLLLPILTAGLVMSRAAWLARFHLRSGALRTRLFPPSKWAGLFPSAAYRRSAPPQLALGCLKWRRLGCFGAAGMVLQRRKTGLNRHPALIVEPTQITLLGMLRCKLNIFATQKASVGSNPRWPLLRAGGPAARRRSFLYK